MCYVDSLHSNSQLDVDIKGDMVCDMLNLAGFRLPDSLDVNAKKHQSDTFPDHG